jgi:hypothetical protein
MASQTVCKIEDLNPPDMELLTQLLSLTSGETPTTSWLEDQQKCLSTFPSTLLKRSSLLPLSKRISFKTERVTLCKTHKILNSRLIRDIFCAVSAECTSRQARLEPKELLPESLSIFLARLQKTNSLWLSPLIYNQTFGAKATDISYECITSGCEACILAAVGGNSQIVTDLRISVLGRKKTHHVPDPLLLLLETWLDWTGHGDELRKDSILTVKEIRHFRRHSQKARRRERNSTEIQADNGEVGLESWKYSDQEVAEGDSADNIVEYYSQRMSRDAMRKGNVAEGIHPAFRDSIVFCAQTGTFRHNGEPSKARPDAHLHDDSAQTRQKSVVYADMYRDLIGAKEMEEEEEDSDERGCLEGEEMRASRWDRSNFF